MPAKHPPIAELTAARLAALGQRIRAHRKLHKVTATTAAEAAGMSRVTLHRIERGEPSVTMGAYMSAIAVIGLQFDVADRAHAETGAAAMLPARIRLDEYPQLEGLAWQQRHGVSELTPAEALNLYERNWRHVDQAAMSPREQALLALLAAALGGGRLLV